MTVYIASKRRRIVRDASGKELYRTFSNRKPRRVIQQDTPWKMSAVLA